MSVAEGGTGLSVAQQLSTQIPMDYAKRAISLVKERLDLPQKMVEQSANINNELRSVSNMFAATMGGRLVDYRESVDYLLSTVNTLMKDEPKEGKKDIRLVMFRNLMEPIVGFGDRRTLIYLHPDFLKQGVGATFLDWDETCSFGGVVSPIVKARLRKLVAKKVYIVIITGRNRQFVIDQLAEVFVGMEHEAMKYVRVFYENGCGNCAYDGSDIQLMQGLNEAYLANEEIRGLLSQMVHQEKNLKLWDGQPYDEDRFFLGRNAEKKVFLIPRRTSLVFSYYIESTLKEHQLTFEGIRDPQSGVPLSQVAESQHYLQQVLEGKFKEWGTNGFMYSSMFASGFDILDIIYGKKIGKSLASGQGLEWIAKKTGIPVAEVAQHVVSAGDSISDFETSRAIAFHDNQTFNIPHFDIGKAAHFFPDQSYPYVIGVAPNCLNDDLSYGESSIDHALSTVEENAKPFVVR